MKEQSSINIKGARTHNLKDVSVTIPIGSLTVVTGVSGSGKSSLAFDTLYAEGQRRYAESLSTYARQFLDQMEKPRFVAADTMDLWLNIALSDLLKLLKRLDAFVLNDSEAHQLTKEDNVFAALKKIHKLGPRFVIIKKGSHGSILSGPGGCFICPAYPLHRVVDPTGAGDSFVGGLMGYLATAQGAVETHIRRAMIYGSVVASFCCEGFGLLRTTRIRRQQIDKRVQELEKLTRF